jgi:tetratricopeptide (TPR) repeat protein
MAAAMRICGALQEFPIRTMLQGSAKVAGIAALIAFVFAAIPFAHGQQPEATNGSGISVEANQQVFATMCALDAAGFDADVSTLAQMPGRLALRDNLLKMNGPATEALRAFYRDHQLAQPSETLSRYITFALAAGPPPKFALQGDRDLLPPDVLAIEGFQEILASFYAEAHLGAHWTNIEPEYNRAIARDQAPLRRIVTVTNAYLRELLKPSRRTFTVYVEPLVGNRINFRNFGDHYSIVIGTGQDIPITDIQHAYLHFMLGTLPLRYRKEVDTRKALMEVAAAAPRLPVQYQTDFLAFIDECLIKAVELRLRKMAPPQLEAALIENDRSGFILVRTFVTQLQKFEKAEPAMTYYYPDMIAGIDVHAEKDRVAKIKFAPNEPEPAPEEADKPAKTEVSELDRMLADGDRQIGAQDVPGATATFEKILEKYPNEPRAIYGLAIASVLAKDADRAKALFTSLVYTPTGAMKPVQVDDAIDSATTAWSHVYLGRIYDLEDERELALIEYRAALAVDGAPEAARVAAERGAENGYQPRSHDDNSSPQKP